ncbi:unnamed protein product [Cladocopium goreaui]|uniref:PPPDE domain-containing protein n=1 Tax=Cladocopium goreaui TaxID=2562237 RepID=A0A9P1CF80_9DINO|nr:unnamed protein product [Cladocopium goreaui]
MGQSHGGVGVRKRRISLTSRQSLTSNESEWTEHSHKDVDDGSSSDEDDDIDPHKDLAYDDMILLVMTPNLFSLPQQERVVKNVKLGDNVEAIGRNTVLLHVYDLDERWEGPNNMIVCPIDEFTIGGAFHSGVEVFGNEWSYGKRGVTCQPPRTAEDHVYRCSIPLGNTDKSIEEVAVLLQELCREWKGSDYDLFAHNCCSFAGEFCRRLGVGDQFPSWIDRFARLLANASHGLDHVGTQVRSAFGSVEKGLGQLSIFVSSLVVDDVAEEEEDIEVIYGDMDDMDNMKEGTYIQVSRTEIKMTVSHRWLPRNARRVAPKLALVERMAIQQADHFQPGSNVEYWSSRGWIPTQVKRYDKVTGLYDLECKPQVHRTNVRPACEPQKYAIGEWIQYYSVGQKCWGPAQVLEFTGRNYAVTCKQGFVPPWKLRKWKGEITRPQGCVIRGRGRGQTVNWDDDRNGASVFIEVGSLAEPGSAKSSTSISAGHCSFHLPVGLPGTPKSAGAAGTEERVSHKASENSQPERIESQPSMRSGRLTAVPDPGSSNYAAVPVGSFSMQMGVPAGAFPGGTEARPMRKASENSQPERMESQRSEAAQSTRCSTVSDSEAEMFPEGSLVEYRSQSNNECWMKAVVRRIHLSDSGSKLYDLNIREKADPSRIRLSQPQPQPSIPRNDGKISLWIRPD